MKSNLTIDAGKLHYLGLKNSSTIKGNLIIISYMIKNERGNYIIDFDDCKGSWHSLMITDIEASILKKISNDLLKSCEIFQKRKEISPRDFNNIFEILSIK